MKRRDLLLRGNNAWDGRVPASFIRQLGPAAWYRYGVGISSSGGLVSAWADQSGNARDLAQAGATKPTLEADNAITTDGSDDFIRATFTLNQPFHVFALLKRVTVDNTGRCIIAGGTADSVALYSGNGSNSQIRQYAGSFASDAAGPAQGVYAAYESCINGAGSGWSFNNGTRATGNPGANNPGGITLGRHATLNLEFSNTSYKEVIVFASELAAEHRVRVVRYLMQLGGI